MLLIYNYFIIYQSFGRFFIIFVPKLHLQLARDASNDILWYYLSTQ